ncbi:hypothetical protein [Pseudomonas beijingensis]|uniref:hypothetical protein n=1 Tax=Pseudomonas beijingensis TaxID=2954101 RepID=UPI002733900A|nr:hypothetical protein [Pseudomonas sp. FP2262]WLH43919.1 hypothetical protein PSH83_16145 [Pseudomonas sp. FP2262]
MELLKVIKAEWAVIAMAPFSFLILAALMFGAAYFIACWRYTAVIEQVKATSETLKERLHLRSEQTEAYREKAAKYDEKLAEVVDSGETELRDKTLKLVADLREFIGRFRRLETSTHDTRWFSAGLGSSEQEQRRGWDEYSRTMINSTYERNDEYDRRFKVEAMMLRDELLSRLPGYESENQCGFSYERPTNLLGFDFVADDLERMAKAL